MTAEPAGGAAVTSAPEPTNTTTPAEAATPPADPKSAEMVRAILLEDGQSEEVVEKVAPTEDKPNADTRTTTSDHAREEVSRDRPDEAHAQTPKPKAADENAAAKKSGEEKDDEVTAEQEESWEKSGALARIHKLTAQRNAARDEAKKAKDEAAAKGAAAGSPRATPTADDPLADVESITELRDAVQLYNEQIEWLAAHPDGANDVAIGLEADGKTPIKGDLTPAQISTMKAKAERILREAVPQRAAMLQEKALHDQVAKQELPAMFEEGTEENKFYTQALRDIPGIRNLPGASNMIRWAWMGMQQELETAAAKKNGKDNGKVDPKLEPFLNGGNRRLAPEAPGVRSAGRTDAGRTAASEKVAQAEARVKNREGGAEAEEELVGALLEDQSAKHAPLV
jgi:hypothetical protein